ncbi:MAG: endonuclease III domain-containing protein [Pseudomonadota bacterium]|nr:MAG: endonuclease III domain-containing protein [Pseudomonadota bacterium]
MTPGQIYSRLYRAYGPQHWWPGDTPFEIMVGAILTQNTAWPNVERAISNLRANNALAPQRIAAVHVRRLATWLKPSGYFNIKAKRLKSFCRWLMAAGCVHALGKLDTPLLRHQLLAVHGIGPETADDILLYAFSRPVFVIDAYTRRVFERLGMIAGNEGYETLRHWFESGLAKERDKVRVFNEYHALIVRHGKDYCKVRPRCAQCCLRTVCLSAQV